MSSDTSSNPDIKHESKPSFLSKLNPHHKPKKEEEIPPALAEKIEEMKQRKLEKLQEMEKEGKKPGNNDSDFMAGAVNAAAISGSGLMSLGG